MRRSPPRPVWSAWWLTLLGLLFAIAVAVPVLTAGGRPALERWKVIVGAVAAALWAMLAVGLYRGVRVRRDEPLPSVASVRSESGASDVSGVDLFDVGFDGIDHPFGFVLGILLWIVVAVGLIFFLPAIVDGVLYAIVALIAALAWIARRALRQVFARSPRCRGRLGLSLKYASVYATLYVGWLLATLAIADVVAR